MKPSSILPTAQQIPAHLTLFMGTGEIFAYPGVEENLSLNHPAVLPFTK